MSNQQHRAEEAKQSIHMSLGLRYSARRERRNRGWRKAHQAFVSRAAAGCVRVQVYTLAIIQRVTESKQLTIERIKIKKRPRKKTQIS